MASLNKVQLIGRLGKDPEIKISNSITIANLSLATTATWKDQSGKKQERTDWHNIVMFRGLAEIAEKWLSKGSEIYVEGNLRTEEYNDREGVKRYTTKVYAENMQMLGGKKDTSTSPAPQAATNKPQTARANNDHYYAGSSYDNDLPF